MKTLLLIAGICLLSCTKPDYVKENCRTYTITKRLSSGAFYAYDTTVCNPGLNYYK